MLGRNLECRGTAYVHDIAKPANVLELQPSRVGQVDVGLRRALDQQGPGLPAIRIRDQFDRPLLDLGPGLRVDPADDIAAAHPPIMTHAGAISSTGCG